MNAFDGVLTILGVLVGGYFGHVRDAGAVVTLGLAASFAMGVSGFYGAYMTEKGRAQPSPGRAGRIHLEQPEGYRHRPRLHLRHHRGITG